MSEDILHNEGRIGLLSVEDDELLVSLAVGVVVTIDLPGIYDDRIMDTCCVAAVWRPLVLSEGSTRIERVAKGHTGNDQRPLLNTQQGSCFSLLPTTMLHQNMRGFPAGKPAGIPHMTFREYETAKGHIRATKRGMLGNPPKSSLDDEGKAPACMSTLCGNGSSKCTDGSCTRRLQSRRPPHTCHDGMSDDRSLP